MNEALAAALLKGRSRMSIAHHVPGRIRLRFAPDILTQVPELKALIDSGGLEEMAGVTDARVNPFAFSIVVSYDTGRIAPSDWETLIAGGDAEAEAVLRRLLES
ncbi:MAG: hypothetical protein CMM50_17075 [Rhodospirillaceae bacterium]|nr:hypothetical protein [Rhodospirillaceae bacterium]